MLRNAFRKSRTIVLAAAAVGGVVAAAGILHSDLLLTRGFGKAFRNSTPTLSFDTAAPKDGAQGPASGDEGYWLTRSEVESPSPFAKPLAVGDRITIAGSDGHERRLEVTDLKAIGDSAVRGTQLRLMLVTCRVTDPDSDGAMVRFIIEAEPAAPALPQPAKAL
jgi:hypothetical protein